MNTVQTPVETRFETPGAIALVLRSAAGHVRVSAEDVAETTVVLTPLNAAGEEAVDGATVEHRGHTLLVDLPRHRGGLLRQPPSVRVEILCPTASTLELHTESAAVEAHGTYAEASISSGSGDVVLGTVTGAARLKTGSGDLRVGLAEEALAVSSGSGDVLLARSGRQATVTAGSGDISVEELDGELVTKTGSGDVVVGRLRGRLVTKTGSGDLAVQRAESGAVQATAASGSVTIGVAAGTAAWLDLSTLSGRVRQELGESDAPPDGERRVEITGHTVSGDLRVHRS